MQLGSRVLASFPLALIKGLQIDIASGAVHSIAVPAVESSWQQDFEAVANISFTVEKWTATHISLSSLCLQYRIPENDATHSGQVFPTR